LISWREETLAKLARAKFEQKKITTFTITSSHGKIKNVRFY
jgi:UDP-N-acetylmuramyl pentapeptide synthase